MNGMFSSEGASYSLIQLVPDEMDMLQHEVVAFRHEIFSQSFMFFFGFFYYYYLLEKI